MRALATVTSGPLSVLGQSLGTLQHSIGQLAVGGQADLCVFDVSGVADAGVAAGPCLTAEQVIGDPHVAARNMLVEIPRPEGGDPVLTPGNPIKASKLADGPEERMPWLGEHTDAVLAAELSLDDAALDDLRARHIIA